MDLDSLGLPSTLRNRLIEAGIATGDDLAARCGRELLSISGVGPVAVARIQSALAGCGLQLAADEWAPLICEREGKPRGDATMASFWLCEECTVGFIDIPFNGAAPIWSGQTAEALCSHCYRLGLVRIHQWVVCPVCERVLRSIGKGIVAARYVLERWRAVVAPVVPALELVETDPPGLRRRTNETIRGKVASADFTAFDHGHPVVGFELKSGPSSAGAGGIGKPMSEFQLDASDCDDITAVAAETKLPMVLIHAQIRSRPAPPTLECVATGLWWVPIREMLENLRAVRNRPRETRPACYYSRRMFRPFESLGHAIGSQWLEEELRRARKGDRPVLYRLPNSPGPG